MTLHDRSVLLTGHTGFKGGWLALWLAGLGARVHGYALQPPTSPSLFEVARVREVLASDARGDIRDRETLGAVLARNRPEVIFHLAAQPLVAEGYRDPIDTLTSNVMGTANLLEAVRSVDSVRAVVVVATDKVYENHETGTPYAEDDRLGGHDPYSASKAAAEIIVASFRSSFFGANAHPARIASARAGNVIGGGDWAADRLVPDCLRAFPADQPVRLRHPGAIRPWQHVLEPLAGYIELATSLLGAAGERYARAWNFGPDPREETTVGEVAGRVAELWGGSATVIQEPDQGWREAGVLRLDSRRAHAELGWARRLSLPQALDWTVAWHRAWGRGEDMQQVSRDQIAAYGRSQPR